MLRLSLIAALFGAAHAILKSYVPAGTPATAMQLRNVPWAWGTFPAPDGSTTVTN